MIRIGYHGDTSPRVSIWSQEWTRVDIKGKYLPTKTALTTTGYGRAARNILVGLRLPLKEHPGKGSNLARGEVTFNVMHPAQPS